jgi:hypothetical protein
MKRGIISVVLMIFLCSFISADIIFTGQFESVYNLGETIPVPVTIKTLSDVSGTFQMDLICNGTAINFYKNGIKMTSGEEKKIESSLVLIRNIIGNERGTCRVKAILNGEYVLTQEFKISDSLEIESTLTKTKFDVRETISITGKVIRENGEKSSGFIEARIVSSENIVQEGTISNGVFNVELSVPSNLKAGNYILQIKAFEKDSDGITTNNKIDEYEIKIKQMPKNIELIFENKEINPGDSVKVKAILHDQTGESITSNVFITIKNSADKILEQKEMNTEEFLEYAVKSSESPSTWKVYATSNKLSNEATFSILEKESVEIQIMNKTLLVKNTGNVVYNKTILVQIENSSLNIPVNLKVGESRKYAINAPDGDYNVRIVSDNNGEISELISLTGKAVEVKEMFSYSSIGIYLWIILILVLALIALIFLKKVYQKNFFGKMHFKNKTEKELPIIGDDTNSKKGNKAEVSLSIKGEKQEASFVCLRIKNFKELKSKKGSGYETWEKIKELAEDNKATIYENQDYTFFILAPTKTRTFKNEQTALEIAENIQGILIEHNHKFKEKINFGIALDSGTIIAKIEEGIFKFMSMGPLVTSARKIASLSNEKILLSEKMNNTLRLVVKTEKETKEGFNVYVITKIKKENEEARKFIDKFMNRQKGD